jgi:4-oxalocrotonate tautomerase
MPLVHIDLLKGREPEAIEAMMSAVANAIATSLPAGIDSIRVIVNEMEPHQYSVGGQPWPVVAAERAAAAAEAERAEAGS